MRIGLFIPCYIDQFYPRVGIATLELLERQNLRVEYPGKQTCCGQPMANSGCEADALPAMRLFVEQFGAFDYIVTPSGSCALHIREHYDHLEPSQELRQVCSRTYELCEFFVDVLGHEDLGARFPYRVGLHQSCHGLRGLRLGQSSERVGEPFSKPGRLLERVSDIQLVDLDRSDECCGFGGTFAVSQPALSAKMGRDRLADHARHGAEVITATDMSCLMHLEGLIRRQQMDIRVIHVAEILNSR